jgi:hypothetical protein
MAAAKKPAKGQIPAVVTAEELGLYTTGAWTPERIVTAERQADQGVYTYAAELVERMLCDDRIDGVTEKLAGVGALPLEFESGQPETSNEDDPLCQALEEDWWAMLTEEHITHLVKWGRVFGFSLLHAVSWEPGPSGRLLPQWETWNPRNTIYDQTRRQWQARTATGLIDITPGDGSWLIWTPYGQKRPTSRAPWHSLAYWWLLKQYAIQDWGLYSNRHGQGVWAATNTSGVISTDETGRAELARKLANMGRRGSAVPPDGFDLKLIEAQAKTWETFKAQIDAADTASTIALAGQNLSTQVTGGSLAAASVHQVVEGQRIRSISEGLSTAIRSQALGWWASLNFGTDAVAPWPKWKTEQELDPGELAKRLGPIGTFLGQLADRGVQVDVLEFCEEFGIEIPIAEEGKVTMGKAAPAAPAVPEPAQTPGTTPQASMRERIESIQALATGTRDGSDYADRVEAGYLGAAIEALGPDIDAVMECVRKAETPEALRVELARAYADMDPASFASLLEQAETLAHMAGRVSVLQDL